MASDLTDAKRPPGSVFPELVYDAAGGIDRIEPVLTPKVLRKRFFFGLPLISPITKEKITDADIKDYIKRAVNMFEIDAQVEVAPVIRRHRLPFDPSLYHAHIWCEIPNKPVQKVIRLAICSASYSATPQVNDQYPSGAAIYRIPNEWVDMSYASKGKIFVNPINPAFSAIGTSTAVAASGATILQFIGLQGWVPAYWTMECLHGFCSEDGRVPVIVNEAIGARAGIMLLDNLIPLFRTTSQSLGLDGMSQSVTDQLQQLLKQKRDDLLVVYKETVNRIKTITNSKFFASNV
jgi:hypothetical protein